MNNNLFSFIVGADEYFFDGDSLNISKNSKNCYQPSQLSVNSSKNYLRNIALNVTNNCNLKCKYCYANFGNYREPGMEMKLDVAQMAVDILYKSVDVNNAERMCIGFFGGEPLLAFDFICNVVEYVRKINHKGILCKYAITTNATLLNQQISEFLVDNHFFTTVSLDGNKESNDENRVFGNNNGSYDVVVKNISNLIGRLPLYVRMTISNNNIDFEKSVSSILNLKIDRILYALDYDITDNKFAEFISNLDIFFEKYRYDIVHKKYYDISNFTSVIAQLVLKKKKISHCMSGKSYYSISANGKIYKCPRFTDEDEYLVGGIESVKINDFSEFNKNLLKNFEIESGITIMNCKSCVFYYLCGGLCYHHVYKRQGKDNSLRNECFHRKKIFSNILKLICSLSEHERKNYIQFLLNNWNNSLLIV